MSRDRAYSAPGKVMWAGEYAVLDGAPAVMCAVARRAIARLLPEDAPRRDLSPFLAAARAEIVAAYGAGSREADAAARVVVDSSALQEHGTKLGLGSSAAATVAAIAAAIDSADPTTVHALAHRAHAAAQAPRGSRGSGADIAACVHGGFLAVVRADDPAEPMRVRHLALPEGLTPVLVWTGEAADTPSLVARVRAYGAADPAAFAAARAAIAEAAARVIAALDSGDAEATVAALAAAGDALAALGTASGAPLVPASLAPLAALARRHGGAAKPTGAGGGDQILAAFATPGAAARFAADVRAQGMTLVAADVDRAGTRLDATPESE
jgi:phosphomevalonate kinase